MKRIVWLLYFCFWSALLVAQQDFSIKGYLKDADNGKVIDFAEIFLYKDGQVESMLQTYPNEEGLFVFSQVPDGTYTLMIKLFGYDIYSRKLVLSGQSPVDVGVVMLQPLEVGLSEVEIVAEKRQIIYKLDKKVVDASSNMVGNGGSAVDVLENTPSIRVDAEGNVTNR